MNTDTLNPGVTPDAAGQETSLGETGVPQGEQERAYSAQAAAEKETPDWDTFMASPDNAKRLKEYTSGIVQSRLKEARASEETLHKLTPALEVLAARYGTDAKDPDALVNAVLAGERQAGFDRHIAGLYTQGQQLKERFPGFDLRREMENPRFVRMTSPSGGMTVEEAFFAIHREEILKAQASALSRTMQANRARPRESVSRQASSVPVFDPRTASPEQRDALRKKIRSGEKVTPGHEFD